MKGISPACLGHTDSSLFLCSLWSFGWSDLEGKACLATKTSGTSHTHALAASPKRPNQDPDESKCFCSWVLEILYNNRWSVFCWSVSFCRSVSVFLSSELKSMTLCSPKPSAEPSWKWKNAVLTARSPRAAGTKRERFQVRRFCLAPALIGQFSGFWPVSEPFGLLLFTRADASDRERHWAALGWPLSRFPPGLSGDGKDSQGLCVPTQKSYSSSETLKAFDQHQDQTRWELGRWLWGAFHPKLRERSRKMRSYRGTL